MHRQSQRLLMLTIAMHLSCTGKGIIWNDKNNEWYIVWTENHGCLSQQSGGGKPQQLQKADKLQHIHFTLKNMFLPHFGSYHMDFVVSPESSASITENWDFSIFPTLWGTWILLLSLLKLIDRGTECLNYFSKVTATINHWHWSLNTGNLPLEPRPYHSSMWPCMLDISNLVLPERRQADHAKSDLKLITYPSLTHSFPFTRAFFHFPC